MKNQLTLIGLALLSAGKLLAQPTQVTKANVNYIIEYRNLVVDYFNKADEKVEYYEKAQGDKVYKKYIEDKTSTFFSNSTPFFYPETWWKVDPKVFTPSTYFSASDKKFYTSKMKSVDSTLRDLSTNAQLLSEYDKTGKFKEDNFQKGKEYAKIIFDYIDKYYATKTEVMNKMDEIAEKVFTVSMEGNPMAPYLIPMNKTLNTAEKLTDLLQDTENMETNKPEIDKLLEQLATDRKTLEALRPKLKEKFEHKHSEFVNFDYKISGVIENATKFCKKVMESPDLLQQYDYDTIWNNYNYLIDGYNTFIE